MFHPLRELFTGKNQPSVIHIDSQDPTALSLFTQALRHQVKRLSLSPAAPVIMLCIGSDRSTGDALGPLIGSKLCRYRLPRFYVYGTLEEPVHAVNLMDTLREIEEKYPSGFIIAADACLGRLDNVGKIQIGLGALKPGAGVKKELPPVGDLHITGIVNVGGFMEHIVLQSTRLSMVMKLADLISQGVFCCFNNRRFLEETEKEIYAQNAFFQSPTPDG